MRDYFMFAGIDSRDYDTYIAVSNAFDAPERDVTEVEIPGRNGTLTLDNGRYRNHAATLTAYIPRGMADNTAALRNALLAVPGYARYEEALTPDEFRIARYTGGFALDTSDRVGAAFTLTFSCKPQRFLKAGERTLAFEADGVLVNPSRMTARPLVRVYGVGTFEVGGTEVTVTRNPGYIDLDCDIEDARMGSLNCNGFVRLTDFPSLAAGENAVTLGAGITRLEITPRWWIL